MLLLLESYDERGLSFWEGMSITRNDPAIPRFWKRFGKEKMRG